MNVNDSHWLRRALLARGFSEAGPEEARVIILNTCSVRDKPEQKVYSLLGRVRRATKNPEAFVAVGGCVAQQVGEGFFKRFEQVRLVFGTDALPQTPETIERLCGEPKLRVSLLDFSEYYPEREAQAGAAEPSAFVNIMQGCDNFCAYCIVPFTRGRQKSRAPEAVLEECAAALAGGAREITLLGQNVNSYGQDADEAPGKKTTFAELLFKVAALPGLARLRFVTPHPKDIAPEVIEAFGSLPALCPKLHLPLQSGSDRILDRMGRKYDMAAYRGIVERLRAARPDIQFSTDVIVGFPGETEEDFEQTLAAMREIGFANSFSFCYSDRPGTTASKLDGKLPLEIKAERLARLQDWQNAHTQACLDALVNTRTDVLLEEGPGKKPRRQGRDPYGNPVHVRLENAELPAGSIVPAHIEEAKKHSLLARQAGEPW